MASDPKHLICTVPTCRHPKSFHKNDKSKVGCSAFGCKCTVKPDTLGKFTKIVPKKAVGS